MECGTILILFVDEAFLCEMGIYDEVEEVLEKTGWKSLMTLSCETNVEDTYEFFVSLEG